MSLRTTDRVPGIDVLRGLCIVAVVLQHIHLRIAYQQSAIGQAHPALMKVLFWSGFQGVRVFFVISGFLITSWSVRRWGSLSALDWRQFYRMRFARIVPCLAALLVLLTILASAHVTNYAIDPRRASLPRALLAGATFHINWLEAQVGHLPGSWGVLWSLSVEEAFYLLFPILCLWARPRRVLVPVLCAFVLIGPFARSLTPNELWADYGYLQCADSLALGCLAAIVSAGASLSDRRRRLVWLSGLGLFLLIEVFRRTSARIGFYKVGLDMTLLSLGVALLLIALAASAREGARIWAPLRWFGRHSYEVYLTHMFVVWPMVSAYHRSGQSLSAAPAWFAATMVLAGMAGALVARLYSEPANRALRAWRSPRDSSTAVGVAL